MSPKQRGPRKAGNVHKLAVWVRRHRIAAGAWAPFALPLLALLLLRGITL